MKITPYNNHEGFSCPVTLGPQPENTGSAEAFVLIQSNNACHLSRSDHNPWCFLVLPSAQVQHLLGEFFLGLQRQIGTQNIQACPHSVNTLACGKLDSWTYLRALAAISTHAREYLINHSRFEKHSVSEKQMFLAHQNRPR
jgi:hypothetical protein